MLCLKLLQTWQMYPLVCSNESYAKTFKIRLIFICLFTLISNRFLYLESAEFFIVFEIKNKEIISCWWSPYTQVSWSSIRPFHPRCRLLQMLFSTNTISITFIIFMCTSSQWALSRNNEHPSLSIRRLSSGTRLILPALEIVEVLRIYIPTRPGSSC